MDVLEMKRMEGWNGSFIEVSIEGEEGEEKALAVQKILKKIQPCPDGTHLRLYFDDISFLAVPFASRTVWEDKTFIAYDEKSRLFYRVKPLRETNRGAL